MATFVLIHGAGDRGAYWELVARELRSRGHEAIAPDLPCEDDTATLADNAEVVIRAIDGREKLVVVAQSFGGYVAPIVCDRVPARVLVLVAGMVPKPGEPAGEMFANTGYHYTGSSLGDERGTIETFYHDVDPDVAAAALANERRQSSTTGDEPWPLASWPDVPIRYVLCSNDRMFPSDWVRKVVRDRLGIEPDVIESGHCPALSKPVELTDMLVRFATEAGAA